MKLSYDSKYDLLYIRFGKARKVINKPVNAEITLDLDRQGRLVGIEILSASRHIDLSTILPIKSDKNSVAR